MRDIYLDNNATTQVVQPVLDAMIPLFGEAYANPSSPYAAAQHVLTAIAEARGRVAGLIGAGPAEILFTSGGTESNTTVLQTVTSHKPNARILVSSVEHPSVIETARALERRGAAVDIIPVDSNGTIYISDYCTMLYDDTVLVSVMTANNETGIVYPVAELAELAHRAGALFHTDAVQAAGKWPLDVRATAVDYLSLAAHKLHGPKGVGVLYVREGAPFEPLFHGGGHEGRRRAGTLNAPGIVGFGAAAALAGEALEATAGRMLGLRERLEEGLLRRVPGVTVIGGALDRLPNTSSLLFDGVNAETLLARLDLEGVSCSAGSACMAGSPEPSRVLTAMGLTANQSGSVIRLSLSRLTTGAEIARVLDLLPPMVADLRALGSGA